MNKKEIKFMKGACKAQWRKIEPRDWFRMTENNKEIGYGAFGGYVDRSDDKRLRNLFKIVTYNKKEDKKQCRRSGYISDYFDYF